MDMATTFTLKANVTGQNQIKGLEKGLGQLSRKSDATAGAMKRLKGAAGGAIGALKGLLPVLGVAGLAKFGNDVLQLGDRLQKMSEKTGASVETLDKLRQASNLAGTDFGALDRLFPMLLVEDLICHIFPVQVEISLAIFLLKCLSDILFVLSTTSPSLNETRVTSLYNCV